MLGLFVPSHIIASYDYNNWIESSSPIVPRKSYAIGYDSTSRKIWILGGSTSSRSLLSYHTSSNVFTDYNTTLPGNLYGDGDFYTQIDYILYMIS
eukprot:765850_1